MTKDEEIRYLKFLLTMINNKIVNMTHPYNLTINEIQQEIRTLEDLREILEEYKDPITIKLQPQEFRRRKQTSRHTKTPHLRVFTPKQCNCMFRVKNVLNGI